MKKITVSLFILLSAWSFQACNSNSNNASGTDSSSTTTSTDTSTMNTAGTSTTDTMSGANKMSSTPASQDAIDFAKKAAIGGMMEVQLGQLAQQKASNQRVKDFGQMMVTDHSQANDQLKNVASQTNIQLPTSLDDDHQKKVNDLSNKSGKDFDKAYMSMMVDDHKKDIKEFQDAAKNLKDQQVKDFATNTLPVLQKHLDSATTINKAVH